MPHDRGNETAVIGFAFVDAAAIGVELGLVGVSIEAEIFEIADAGALEPQTDEARQIEHAVAVANGQDEEAVIVFARCEEPCANSRPTS